MEYVNLGKSGLKVSRLCLGCMSYGVPERGVHPWSLGYSDSRPFIARGLEAGINFFDTSNSYSDGTSERTPRPSHSGTDPSGRGGDRNQGLFPGRKDPNGRGLPQGDPHRDRREPEEARHRLR